MRVIVNLFTYARYSIEPCSFDAKPLPFLIARGALELKAKSVNLVSVVLGVENCHTEARTDETFHGDPVKASHSNLSRWLLLLKLSACTRSNEIAQHSVSRVQSLLRFRTGTDDIADATRVALLTHCFSCIGNQVYKTARGEAVPSNGLRYSPIHTIQDIVVENAFSNFLDSTFLTTSGGVITTVRQCRC